MDLGNSIKPKHVKSQPVFDLQSTDAPPTPTRKGNATYVLALTDPDATSRSDPVKAQMCHWIATNITMPPSTALSIDPSEAWSSYWSGTSRANEIEELMPYFPPTPPPKTGYHRYVFVVLTHRSQDDGGDVKKPKDRPHWGYGKIGTGVREWAEENNLVAVGKSPQLLTSLTHARWTAAKLSQVPTSSTPRIRSSKT